MSEQKITGIDMANNELLSFQYKCSWQTRRKDQTFSQPTA